MKRLSHEIELYLSNLAKFLEVDIIELKPYSIIDHHTYICNNIQKKGIYTIIDVNRPKITGSINAETSLLIEYISSKCQYNYKNDLAKNIISDKELNKIFLNNIIQHVNNNKSQLVKQVLGIKKNQQPFENRFIFYQKKVY